MLSLKNYQKRVLRSLSNYFKAVRALGASAAFEQQVNRPYCTIPQLPGLPYVCLRVPTGGGKTLLSSHSISITMRDFLHKDNAVVLWLVPTTPIKDQTLAALRDVEHPYRKAIEETIDTPVTVLDITEALFVQRSTLDNETLIIVSTLAALRIEDTDGRKIYDDNGHLKVLFDGLNESVLSSLEKTDEGSRICYSLANVLKSRRPMVIIDEAHNARTNLSFETLARFSPSSIIEFTATPQTTHRPERGEFASNVLCSISAAELNAEEMIKLPIRLETKADWKDVIAQALGRRKRLQVIANKERRETGEYIRPIVLLQAQPRSQTRETINVGVILQALMEDFKIPREEIAIATGDTKELEGVNLFAQDCKIKFIITVSALKEGWDCSFAYVLCSVAEIGSSTAVEQLVGRVLRLPYAKKKNDPELNRAYAYVSSTRFENTLTSLTDALVENGFERFEAETLIAPPTPEPDLFDPEFYESEEEVEEEPNLEELPEPIKKKVTYNPEAKKIVYRGTMSEDEKIEFKKAFKTDEGKKAVDSLFSQAQQIPKFDLFNPPPEPEMPKEKGDFKVPYLLYKQGDLLKLFEESIYLERAFELSKYDPKLSEGEFSTKSNVQGQIGEVTVSEQGRVEAKFVEELVEQLSLDIEDRGWTIAELTNWLDRKIPHPDITMKQSTLFIYKVIQHLIDEREFELSTLVHYKYKLREAIEKLIGRHRETARKEAWQACLDLGEDVVLVSDEDRYCFTFDKEIYPASWYYDGRIKFNKHYHELVGELKSSGEEYECALLIDQLPEVKHWIRNIDSDSKYSFWLQKSKGRFYPDFVAELNDGRIVVIEYKGDHIKDGPEELEKKAVGELWAARSNGKCLFYWATKDNVNGLRDFVK
ncbi:DEAD/DEAH box helicase [Paenibacillus hamazuiensis]|uniref:DEAD/DEAH box helicase n=1 Tax=Paenibacillus hamazuiensis TaxID=2936508 RepID=UPI00200FD1EE|nr:DEAD/DEAH box helicase family protein [Paenibacillus hamazuiensis]